MIYPYAFTVPTVQDERGSLSFAQIKSEIPFYVKRIYYIYNNTQSLVRGEHAHKKLEQVMICMNGSVDLLLKAGGKEYIFNLSSPNQAVYIPKGCWRSLSNFSKDVVCVVLASEVMQEEDYIKDYEEFVAWEREQACVSSVPYIAIDRCTDALKSQLQTGFEEFLSSGEYILGDAVEQFEKSFAHYCGASNAIGVGNGLEAITLTLMAWGIGPGDEVIVPANTFIATALAVSECGANCVLVDVDEKTYNIDPHKVETAITDRTKAVIPVHLYGQSADMNPLMDLAQRFNLKIFEDSAQAHGAQYGDKKCGSLGHGAGFSFYPTKNLGAYGDAGMITTNDSALAEKLRMMRNYGCKQKYKHEILGTNARLDALQARLLSIKLDHLNGWNDRRRALADKYIQSLSGISAIVLPYVAASSQPVWHVFAIRVKNGLRDQLKEFLENAGIGTNVHYPVPIHLQAAYKHLGHKVGDFPITEKVSEEILSLPLDPMHTDGEIEFVISKLKEFFA